MAAFMMKRQTLALLCGCISVGLEGVPDSDGAQEIAALLEELEGIEAASEHDGAEITVMGDFHAGTQVDEIAAKITEIRNTANRPSTRDIPRAPVIDDEPQPAFVRVH